MTRIVRGIVVLVAALTVLAQPLLPSTSAQAQSTTSTTVRPALLADVPGIALQPIASGSGTRPTLSWSAVPGAASYAVTVYTASGTAYWAWLGAETSVDLGADAGQLPATAPGPVIATGMTWQVLAYGPDAGLLAASDRQPCSP